MERYAVGFSCEEDRRRVMSSVCTQLLNDTGSKDPILILFYADYDNFSWYAKELRDNYPFSTVIGVSTYVGFSSRGHSHKGLTCVAFMDGIEVAAGSLLEVKRYPDKYADSVTKALEQFNSYDNMMCMEYTTAFGNCEELVLDTLAKVLKPKNIPVFGSSAGTKDGVTESFVSLNGEVYSEGCVFCLIRNKRGRIKLYKENMYRPSAHTFTATDVDCEERIVYEYDNRPAADVMCECLQIKKEELAGNLEKYPVGRMIDDKIHITDGCQVLEDGAISYYARIYNRTKMTLLELDDIEKVWDRTAKQVVEDGITPSFALVVNCTNRTKLYERERVFEDFMDKMCMEYGEYAGVAGYGEQLDYEHLNQTMLLALFE